MNKTGLLLDIYENLDDYQISHPILFKEAQALYNSFPNLVEEIKSIKEHKLFSSSLHGIHHSEKVLFFSLILGLALGLDDDEMRIIIDAAKYHDIGRDRDDCFREHGMLSAIKMPSVINVDDYTTDNYNLLCGITVVHSTDDKDELEIMKKYNIEDLETFRKFYYILKDADALDRKRFDHIHPADLNPKFLRYSLSKNLIKCSEEINDIYGSRIYKRD